jgi:RNA polymerase sigma factor (sigma-70 family)
MNGDDSTASRSLLLSIQELASSIRTEPGNDAFLIEELYQRVMPTLITVALKITPDCDTAEDIAHEVFVDKVVAKHLSEYHDGNFMGWLCTCVQNRCKSFYRLAAQRHEQSMDDASLDSLSADRHEPSLEATMVNELAWQCAWAKFDREASILEKQTLMLYLQMEEVKLVAEVMDRSAEQVSSTLYKARQRLARFLVECGHNG